MVWWCLELLGVVGTASTATPMLKSNKAMIILLIFALEMLANRASFVATNEQMFLISLNGLINGFEWIW